MSVVWSSRLKTESLSDEDRNTAVVVVSQVVTDEISRWYHINLVNFDVFQAFFEIIHRWFTSRKFFAKIRIKC
jgi:hypothetical protein